MRGLKRRLLGFLWRQTSLRGSRSVVLLQHPGLDIHPCLRREILPVQNGLIPSSSRAPAGSLMRRKDLEHVARRGLRTVRRMKSPSVPPCVRNGTGTSPPHQPRGLLSSTPGPLGGTPSCPATEGRRRCAGLFRPLSVKTYLRCVSYETPL